jgi:hypothetical protein
MQLASRTGMLLGWLMLAVGLLVIARNPAVPSLQYAVLWLGVMAVARGISALVGPAAIAIDLSLLLLCCIGLEIGGLILVPSIIAFTVGDALRPGRTEGATS